MVERSSDAGARPLSIVPVTGIGEVEAGADIAALLLEHADLHRHDVVVVTQKIVSKAEGRRVPTDPPSKEDLVLSEATRVLRRRGELFITETRHGFVCANSGVDFSNVPEGFALLLPVDPDRSARRIRDRIRAMSGLEIGVIISDTFGRAWRNGLADVAIGCAGIAAVVDLRGTTDTRGRVLQATQVCIADEIASAADLVMGKAFGVPVAVVRGLDEGVFRESAVAAEVVRQPSEDLFR